MKYGAKVGATPGPWVVFDPGQHGAAYGIEGSDGTAVCWYGITHDNGIRRLEDARLIAAAPELLAVLQSLLSYVECDGQVHGPIVTVARVVIAKATGGAA